jgi:uncharacterized protein YbjT (DUF2867 family)
LTNEKRTAIIAGYTGLVGNELLKQLLASQTYHAIYLLGRRSVSIDDNRVNSFIVDFNHLTPLNIDQVDDVFCCLGTTIKKAKTKEAFRQVDFDYVLHLAQWSLQKNASTFSVVSSVGASSNSGNFYLRTKGQMETALKRLRFQGLYIYRPSLLTGKRNEFRLAEKISEPIMKMISPILLGPFKKYRPIKASQVAKAMTKMVQSKDRDIFILESDAIKALI